MNAVALALGLLAIVLALMSVVRTIADLATAVRESTAEANRRESYRLNLGARWQS